MIEKFTKAWFAKKDALEAVIRENHPENYEKLVTNVVKHILQDEDVYSSPDPSRIHRIDDGDYQGTMIFIIGCGGYQPETYWYIKVYYGSCSGCDTLLRIRGYDDGKPNEKQVSEYMTLSLHIIQGIKEMGEEIV